MTKKLNIKIKWGGREGTGGGADQGGEEISLLENYASYSRDMKALCSYYKKGNGKNLSNVYSCGSLSLTKP